MSLEVFLDRAQKQTLGSIDEVLQSRVKQPEHIGKVRRLIASFLVELPILCVEVGGTRIKVALLPKEASLEKLKRIQAQAFPTADWLSAKLPTLFNSLAAGNPLSPYLKSIFSQVSLSVSGPVFDYSLRIPRTREIPVELKKACEKESHCGVTVDNDAVVWAKGYLAYAKIQKLQPKFPCFATTLGTGVGGALLLDEHTVYGIEVSHIGCDFPRMKPLQGEQPFERWSPHGMLGRRFFNWIFKEQSFTDEEMAPHSTMYNARFQALVEDVAETVNRIFSVKIVSLLVGGGNSRFIQIPKDFPLETTVFSPQNLAKEGLSADTLIFLGCHSNCQKERPFSTIHPSKEDLIKIFQ